MYCLQLNGIGFIFLKKSLQSLLPSAMAIVYNNCTTDKKVTVTAGCVIAVSWSEHISLLHCYTIHHTAQGVCSLEL